MNKPVWLARLLSLGGVLETVAGLGLLVDPAGGASALFGSSMQGPGVAIGRIGGGGLLSLGIACWLARKTPTAPASVGVAWAYLAYNVVTCVTVAWASVVPGGGSLLALGASVLHGVLGAAVLGALLGRGQPSVGS
jgi:hypothetical protein